MILIFSSLNFSLFVYCVELFWIKTGALSAASFSLFFFVNLKSKFKNIIKIIKNNTKIQNKINKMISIKKKIKK